MTITRKNVQYSRSGSWVLNCVQAAMCHVVTEFDGEERADWAPAFGRAILPSAHVKESPQGSRDYLCLLL